MQYSLAGTGQVNITQVARLQWRQRLYREQRVRLDISPTVQLAVYIAIAIAIYCIAGKLGEVWQIYSFGAFGGESLANYQITQRFVNYKQLLVWMVIIQFGESRRIHHAKLSRYIYGISVASYTVQPILQKRRYIANPTSRCSFVELIHSVLLLITSYTVADFRAVKVQSPQNSQITGKSFRKTNFKYNFYSIIVRYSKFNYSILANYSKAFL